MENSEHVSIEMEKLADSLIGKLESLHPSSKNCSIYRVPELRWCLHPRDYTPQMVSIGPFHYGKEELKAMEEHKKKYLKYFLQRTKVRVAHFLAFIKEREAKLRNSYAEIIHLESDEFITMVLVDAVFLIEFFLRCDRSNFRTKDDRIFGKSNFYRAVPSDFLLLENQLPLFILNDLFNLAKKSTYGDLCEEIFFVEILSSWIRGDILCRAAVKENLLETHFSKAEHFLDLILLCLHPSQSSGQIELKDDKNILNENIPSAKELHQAGVKFKSVSNENPLDIRFNKGILEIPFVLIYGRSELVLRNLLVFESMHGYTGYLNDYIITMRYLTNSPEDAGLLIKNGIIGPSKSERVVAVFGKLCDECFMNNHSFLYSDVVANLQSHCKMLKNKWKAALKQNYFNSPWASISIIAAVILLLLTIIQTMCSLITL